MEGIVTERLLYFRRVPDGFVVSGLSLGKVVRVAWDMRATIEAMCLYPFALKLLGVDRRGQYCTYEVVSGELSNTAENI